MIALGATSRNACGVEGFEHVDSVEFERAAPREDVKITQGAGAFQSSPGVRGGIRKKPLDTHVFNRSGDSKGLFLFNLADDPCEQHDLAAEEPERVAALQAALTDWERVLKG